MRKLNSMELTLLINLVENKKQTEENVNAREALESTKQVLQQMKNYKELDEQLDVLLANNATDAELNSFLEEASYNEVLTNEEYTALQFKAQNSRRI